MSASAKAAPIQGFVYSLLHGSQCALLIAHYADNSTFQPDSSTSAPTAIASPISVLPITSFHYTAASRIHVTL